MCAPEIAREDLTQAPWFFAISRAGPVDEFLCMMVLMALVVWLRLVTSERAEFCLCQSSRAISATHTHIPILRAHRAARLAEDDSQPHTSTETAF